MILRFFGAYQTWLFFSVLCPKFPILPKNHDLEQQAANLLSETGPFKDDYQTMLLTAQTKHTGMVEEIL